MNDEKKGEIEKLNETLYSRTRYQDPLDKRPSVKKTELPDVSEKWQTTDLDEMLKGERTQPATHPLLKKIFVFAILFFLATVVVAGFVFMGGATFVSSRNVDIGILGPTTVSAGETFELGISISNTNNADLEFANLSIQYPSGSRNPDKTSDALTYTTETLGVIKAGDETVSNVRLVLLGLSGEVKEIKFSVEYKVKGSNATFYKDKMFEIVIGETPILLTIESPQTVISGDSFTTEVSVTLKSPEILKGVVLKAEYPYGYSVFEATPRAVADDNVWVLGDLSPEDKKTISIRGRLTGEDSEERTFRFYVGVSDGSSTNHNLKIAIISMFNTIMIDRPFIDLDILFNGENTNTYIAPPSRSIVTSVKFKNNLSDKLLNPRLEVSLYGTALDKLSIMPGNNGLYDSNSSKVTWNLTNSLGNPELAPGEDGQVTLRFASLPTISLPAGSSDIRLSFSVTGIPIGTVGQNVVTVSDTRTVKISSQINFSSRALYSLGSFANSGPLPPKVGEETTYTGVFSIGNTRGNLRDSKVVAHLGQGVSWIGASSFTGENIVYNEASNTLTWSIGALQSDTGFSSSLKELSFQISLNPTLGQIGTAPNLITGIVFTGVDVVTGEVIRVENPSLTTKLYSDPAFIQGDDIVVK